MDVDPVQKGTANLGHISFDLGWGTTASPTGVVPITARARIHRGDEEEIRGESLDMIYAGDRHLPVLQRLTKDLQRPTLKFR